MHSGCDSWFVLKTCQNTEASSGNQGCLLQICPYSRCVIVIGQKQTSQVSEQLNSVECVVPVLEKRRISFVLVGLLILLFGPHCNHVSTGFAAKVMGSRGIGLPGIAVGTVELIGHVSRLIGTSCVINFHQVPFVVVHGREMPMHLSGLVQLGLAPLDRALHATINPIGSMPFSAEVCPNRCLRLWCIDQVG